MCSVIAYNKQQFHWLINFFRAEADKSVSGSQRNVIYAIEEPETSQHPNYQIMLMKALLSLSNQPNRQIIVTTHVPALAGLIPIEGIRYVTKDYYGNPVVKTPDNDVLRGIAESLGILPEKGMERAKCIVLVEGKSDVTYLSICGKMLETRWIYSCKSGRCKYCTDTDWRGREC